MQLSKEKIISLLNLLNIEYDTSKISNKGWLSIKCPLHVENTPFGAASVNINSGVIHCQSCGQSISLKKLAEQRNIVSIEDYIPSNIVVKPIEKKREIINNDFNFSYFPLNPEKYNYTSIRGYTKEYCERFNIVHCISGDYVDYFVTPIIDTKRKIKTYEARKLCKYEVLQRYYKNKRSRLSNEERFEKECENKKYRIIKGEIFDEAGNQYFSYDLLYLLKPKVLYPFMSGVWATIYRIDELNFDEDLWLCEGTATIPKLYQYISENSTCVFGAKITPEQMQILKKFKKRIIVVVDLDKAGYQMILSMYENLNDVWVCVVASKDTDYSFVSDIKKCELIEANKFLIRYTF
jgi:5S rRNA maturation endonuclease (ribonuclease M5)